MTVERLVLGSFGTNCYLVGDEKEVIVIDPADNAELIIQSIRSRTLKYILLTHSHIDHIAALAQLKEKFPGAKLALHEDEQQVYQNPQLNLSSMFGQSFQENIKADLLLSEESILDFLGTQIKVIHIPGHTPGGTCYLIKNYLFSGDTLFRMSIGRSDFPMGSHGQLIDNIRKKLFSLPEDTKVFPGHMGETTIGFEKENNPFF